MASSKDSHKEEQLMTCDDIIKTCGSMEDKEKIKYFSAMYEKLHKLHKNLQFCYNTTKREVSSLNADKNKLVLVQSRLESLCRELQKQNKVIKDESLLKIREEEERRKLVSQEFQKTLNNVTTMMTESNVQNTKLGDENKQMAERLASIYEEFKSRENEVERISEQIDIERQLADARCAKLQTEFLLETQKLANEREELKGKVTYLTVELLDSTKKASLLENKIGELTQKLASYSGKYVEFENTISRSGQVFDQCKTEISNMNKQISNLQEEVTQWKNRYYRNVSTIQDLQSDNAGKAKQIENLTKKETQLGKLCRQLNAERKAYITALKELGKNPEDIHVELVEEPEAEEQACSLSHAASGSTDEKTKPVAQKKPSKGQESKKKQRNKKGKELTETNPPMTPKEFRLVALKDELQKLQDQVAEIETHTLMLPSADEPAAAESNLIKLIDTKTEVEEAKPAEIKTNKVIAVQAQEISLIADEINTLVISEIEENQCGIEAKGDNVVNDAGKILVEKDAKESAVKENVQVEATAATLITNVISEAQEQVTERANNVDVAEPATDTILSKSQSNSDIFGTIKEEKEAGTKDKTED